MNESYANKMRLCSIALLVSTLTCQTGFAQSDVIIFNEKLIETLPPGIVLDSLKASKAQGTLELQAGYIDFGKGVCKSLSKGADKKTIMEQNLIPYMGENLSNAIYQAALDTLCPEFKK